MQELLYTSVPRGLKPGSRGFCTVLSTQGMVAPLAAALEGLSGYRPVFPIGHERVAENPVVYSHLKLQVAGKSWYVLSRIADYGLDYSQRTNKLAHHLVLDKSELPAAGPASVLRASGIMRESWEGEPKIVPPKPMSKHPIAPSGMCQAWKEMTGDAGWAGVLAESFLKDPNRPVILLFEPGQDLRPLIDESLSLLPSERRWDVTFSTYFTGSSQGITCLWRGIVVGSKEATESLRFVNALRIDLTASDIGRAEGGELVEAARKGVRPSARPTPPKQTAPREQQQPRVVVMDDAEEPTVYRPHVEETAPEPRAAPLGSHDHSQAPPRLTPSAFKFANARKQPDSGDSTARTSTGRKSVIILGVILLLGSTITAGVFLASRLVKDPHAKPSNALASNDTPQTPAASGVLEVGGSASENTAGGNTNGPKPNTSSSSNHADTNSTPEPPKQTDKPAAYTITLDPPNAKLTSDDADVEVIGEGQQRTVKVAKPDSKQAVTLIARLDGYQELRRELKLEPAQPKPFPMVLVPNTPPADDKKPAEQPSPSDAPKLLALPKVDSTGDIMIHEFVPPLSDGQPKKLTWLVPKSDKFNPFSGKERDNKTLALLHKQQGQDERVGTFTVRDSKLYFSWSETADAALRSESLKKARFCALQVATHNQSKLNFQFRNWEMPNKEHTPTAFKAAQLKLIPDPKSELIKVFKDVDDFKISWFAKDVVIGIEEETWKFERGKDRTTSNMVESVSLAKDFDQEHVRIEIDLKQAVLKIVAKADDLTNETKKLGTDFNSRLEEECKKHNVKVEQKFWFPELKDENHTKIKTELHKWFYNAFSQAPGGAKKVDDLENETLKAMREFFDEAGKLKKRIDSAPANTKKINTSSRLISTSLAYSVVGEGVEPIELEIARFEAK